MLKRWIIGRPLRTEQLKHEKLPVWKALPILSSDALSSQAYGTEQILLVLSAFGATALWYSLPITAAIVGLLALLIVSYRQIIFQYPSGGGAYIVTSDHLGRFPGLIAGASLLVDYTLTCAVSVTAGAEAITSAIPALHPHLTAISVGLVLLVMLVNLRGIRETGSIFALPPYLFIAGIFGMVIIGLANVFLDGIPEDAPPVSSTPPEGLTWFILLRAFSSGCSALTGVEAISDSTPAFRSPETRNAARTLLLLGLLLGTMYAGTSLMAYLYHVTPSETETVLSQIAEHTFGRTLPYYYIQTTTALILILAANTSFTGFPILASIMAKDQFMPRLFTVRGDRLNFTHGIIVLALAAIGLIILFEGDVHRLIPLYAIGVFLSFTLAQAGMVRLWLKTKQPGWLPKMVINALGAVITCIVLFIFAITKFTEGAWIVLLVIPLFVIAFYQIHRHYENIADELRIDPSKDKPVKKDHLIILPVGGVNRVVRNTVSYAQSIGGKVIAFYVGFDEKDIEKMKARWEQWNPGIGLVVTRSRYRSVIDQLLCFINHVQHQERDKHITVLIPEFIPRRWWHRLLHNQTALLIRLTLLVKKDVVVSTVPFHLKN